MIDTCSAILHPHSVICKSAMELLFLVARKTPHERICQHMLICEYKQLRSQIKLQSSSTADDVEAAALELFNEGDGVFNKSFSILDENLRLNATNRLLDQMTKIAGYPEFTRSIKASRLQAISNKIFNAIEYYHLATTTQST
ncbi:unnamed protein product [Haemonchus placei]|uniref:Uncharacterized protein n=1 Tax=Haemonchus placei TaxID=6290 RepID=A0A0N4WXH8_HAEPC|nr:unnamed protein product [Haemonchus placei]